ncbi:aberrant root formation protein 4 [Cucurbita moschata]|uniref:Aberrant root formation protein 4 n=1 Tax=Cucurbita moschata TaxID=3662 RepID=A0A6J1FID0_CUCMO|nr:aberrant root formation protein 4 [Cucurbita moschata]XP_022940402.1 aberrant root formation protein 4 [Cucurbita moschata]
MEKADDHCLSKLQLTERSDARPFVLRLREILAACAKSIENGDTRQSEAMVSELVNCLDSISEAAETELDNGDSESHVFEVLNEIYQFISSPLLDQGTIDTLSFDLPKAVSKFVGVGGCLEIVDNIIDRFVTMCSPRDMLSILCEALDFQMTKGTNSIAPFLSGLSKVIRSIQRRHFEQIKVVVPVVLNALKAVDFETCDEDVKCDTLYDRAMDIANSIQSVCVKLDGKVHEKLQSLLGLYALQIMALFSVSTSHEVSSCLPFVSKLSCFLPFCGLSYVGLITGSDIDKISNIIGEDEDDYTACFSYIKHGACLSVLWGYLSEEVAQAAEEKMGDLKDELATKQTERWKAIGMFRHILSFLGLSWKLKKDAIDFLLSINGSESFDDDQSEYISYMPSIFAALQAVQIIIMYAPDTMLRKNAFGLFKKLLADIPCSERFDMLRALIVNSDSPSMVALLLDLVKGEMHMELCRKRVGTDVQQVDSEARPKPSFWTAGILELVEQVLRPPKGGPPVLPEQSDAVLSALNLYRYVLITEATGSTNHTGVLLKSNLQKSYNEWLLPLWILVTGIMSENKTDYDQIAVDMECALNPVELVLYRCIELVEERLR